MNKIIDVITFAENYFINVNMDRGKGSIELYPAQKRICDMIKCVGGESHFEEEFEV